jgi:hypothetical protein
MPKTSNRTPVHPQATVAQPRETIDPAEQATDASQAQAQQQEQPQGAQQMASPSDPQTPTQSQGQGQSEAQAQGQAESGDTSSREARIRDAAYAAYQRRAGEPGNDVDDWLQAESEVDRPKQ